MSLWVWYWALGYILGIITLNFIELATPLTQKFVFIFNRNYHSYSSFSFLRGFSSVNWSTLAVSASASPPQHLQEAEASSLLGDKASPLDQALLFSSEVHKAFPILLGTFNTHQIIDIWESLRITQLSANKNPFCTRLQTALSTLQAPLPWL